MNREAGPTQRSVSVVLPSILTEWSAALGSSASSPWWRPRLSPSLCSALCSVAESCPNLCDPMNCSTPDFPVLPHLPEFAQTHVHCVSDAIQPSHPLSPPAPLAFSLSQHQGLFQGVCSLHIRWLEFQLQHQPCQ